MLHYDPGQYSRGHIDAHVKPGRRTSSRVATPFLYLSDNYTGGHAWFPLAKPIAGRDRDPAEGCEIR